MATLSPSTTATPATATTNSLKNNSLCPKPSQLSVSSSSQTRRLARKISCKAASNDDNQESSQTQNPANNKLDRRNMLIGLGGLYGAATTLGGASNTFAAPAELVFNKCVNTTGVEAGAPERCCLPGFEKYKQDTIPVFNVKNYPSPALRVRRPAHLVAADKKYMAKFREAIARMRALPDDDPRSFNNQAQVHCAYCDGSFIQKGHDKDQLRFQVHFSWLFLPFHRAYLYFFERICGKLIGDPTFAIPFWNYDHPDGMYMPTIYSEGGVSNPLYNANRNPLHLPPRLVDLGGGDPTKPVEEQIKDNIWSMYTQVSRPKTNKLFMGGKYDAGDEADTGDQGMLELLPHNTVHNWCGNPGNGNQDMGNFFSAARDPIFYAHHGNVDRLWSIWNTLPNDKGKPRANYDDADFLNTYFVFFDENKKPVKIYVRDVLDHKKLGYNYMDRPLPWVNPPKPTAGRAPQTKRAAAPTKKAAEEVKLPRELGQDGFITKVMRPKKSRSKTEKSDKEEVLEVKLELISTDQFIKFDVYLDDEHDHEHPKAAVSYAGSFTSLPHKGGHHNHSKKMKLKLPVTEVIEDIGADDDEYVNVVFVPRAGASKVTITEVKIKYH
uniref:Tyrosinase copper-binding domain-containing protein n=1 Tax=Portulaca oleracea TaxID=46147 RepID=I4DD57_POROL|nr:hypothetical protein [Portulaca oleracea]